jgi:hypothetical protein
MNPEKEASFSLPSEGIQMGKTKTSLKTPTRQEQVIPATLAKLTETTEKSDSVAFLQ